MLKRSEEKVKLAAQGRERRRFAAGEFTARIRQYFAKCAGIRRESGLKLE